MPDTLVFQDALGNVNALTDPTLLPFTAGAQGRFMAPFTIIEDLVPYKAGSIKRQVNTQMREVTIPVTLVAADESTLRTRIRQMASFLNPDLGTGILRVTAPDASQRELNCVYAQGFEGNESPGVKGCVYYQVALVFHAFDPYWYDVATQIVNFALATGTATFFPFFPLRLTSSQIFASQSIVNGGDVEAWPVFTITGPGTNPSLQNLTTGKTLQINTTLAAGQQLVIDTRPGVKTILSGGVSYYSSIASGSMMWSLARGTNAIQITMTGATAQSNVSMTFRNRYHSA